MSYDLAAFEIKNAPKTKLDFLKWLQERIEQDQGFRNADESSVPLKTFYQELSKTYPNMNGPDAPSDERLEQEEGLESRLADYSIGKDLIYIGFAWSESERAYSLMKELCQKYQTGFFNVSGLGAEVILPDATILT